MHLCYKKYVGKYVHEELSCQKGRLQYAKAIETGIIILIMDIKKYFFVFFQRPINFGVLIKGVLYCTGVNILF